MGIVCLAIPSGSPYLSSLFLIILVWSRPLFLAFISSLPMFILSMMSPSSARLDRLTTSKMFLQPPYASQGLNIYLRLSLWLFYLIGSQKHLKLWICLKQKVLPAPNLPQPWCSPAPCIGDSFCSDHILTLPDSSLSPHITSAAETLLCCHSYSTPACFPPPSLQLPSSVTCIGISQTSPWMLIARNTFSLVT